MKKALHTTGRGIRHDAKRIAHHVRHNKHIHRGIMTLISLGLIGAGLIALWISQLQIPDLDVFETRKVAQSTKIFDRSGQVLLYDVHEDAKRTVIPFEDISPYIKNATIAIEDTNFYKHFGIEPKAILRAIIADIIPGGIKQGGSTITQQVIKNTVLTKDQTITRKLKEWFLAIKLEQILTKNQILDAYLNETPYGGNLYGVEEASKAFFGKSAKDVTLAEAAYIAALPQAPTFYSPYGKNKKDLDSRQRTVLRKMLENGYISAADQKRALAETVTFLVKSDTNIRAPHFALMVKDYLIEKYGEDTVLRGGLKVTTTLNYDMQHKMETVVGRFSPTLASEFDASNTAMVAIDPKSGDILALMGSRNYFDRQIQGNFNIATAERQPGSAFKPFVYATAFMKGYTPDTVLFDVKTEFSTRCSVDSKPISPTASTSDCYSPVNYDGIYEGPITIRTALAQSRNIPAIKALYLAGINDSIETAENMGINSLTEPARYGLTLVLGGGEVSLLELTSAYGVFANDGVRNPYRLVLKVEDSKGNVLEEAVNNSNQVIPAQVARQISDILSDPKVRLSSLSTIIDPMNRQIAIKTGTTNDYRDVWVAGYTPSIVVGAWAGKNDATPMQRKVAGLVIAPVFGAFMSEILDSLPQNDTFRAPEPSATPADKPVLRGIWMGGISYIKDKISGKLATEFTPPELREEVISNDVHSILHWIDKKDPTGPAPTDPKKDSQYEYWEYGVRAWVEEYKKTHPNFVEQTGPFIIPTEKDDIHTADSAPVVSITSPQNSSILDTNTFINVSFSIHNRKPSPQSSIRKVELYINNKYITSNEQSPFNIGFYPRSISDLQEKNTLKVVVYDSNFNRGEASIDFHTGAPASTESQ